MDQNPEDVKEQADQPAAAPSDSDQSAASEPQAASPAPEEPKAVPYERFREVNEKYRNLETRFAEVEKRFAPPQPQQDPTLMQVKESLKQLGFMSKEDVDAEMARREADARIGQQLSRLESEWTGKDGRPAFVRQEVIDYAIKRGIPDPEVAFKALKEKEILDWHVQQAIAKSRGVRSEVSDGSGSAQAGTTNGDLKAAIARGDKNALHTLLKRAAGSR